MASDSLRHGGDADRGSAVPPEVALENGMEAKTEETLSQIPAGEDLGVQTPSSGMASAVLPGPGQQDQLAPSVAGNNQPMKTYVLYHANCADGFGAAFAAWMKFGDQAEYIPCSYGSPPPPMKKGSRIFILDFSYPRAMLEELGRDFAVQLVVLDHHATAQADLEGFSGCYFDINKSGSVMAWEYFWPDKPVPMFILYLQDRDLWKWALPLSREFSLALRSYPFNFDSWRYLMNRSWELQQEGAICRRLVDSQVEIMVKNYGLALFDSARERIHFVPPGTTPMVGTDQAVAPAVNASILICEVGEKLLERYPESKFCAVYFYRGDGKRQWSLRSQPGFDCSVIARQFGGGGHRQAAGFVM